MKSYSENVLCSNTSSIEATVSINLEKQSYMKFNNSYLTLLEELKNSPKKTMTNKVPTSTIFKKLKIVKPFVVNSNEVLRS